MQSRRDQVQAYFFVVGRLVSAVVHGKPDSLQLPNRRYGTGTVIGVILGVVIAGVFFVVGLFFPGNNTSWKQEGAIVMNEDNGARYVYADGMLRPVLNFSSAKLAVGGGDGVQSVSQDSLAGTPIGPSIGIPGAPDSLPAAEALDTGPWTTCALTSDDGKKLSLALLLGEKPGVTTTPEQGLLVSIPDGRVFLIWQGKRYLLPDSGTREALGYGDVTPIRVTSGWLNPVPQGKDLRVPDTEGVGEQGPAIAGGPSTVGEIYQVHNPAIDSDQFYLVRKDGLAPLSRTVAAMLLAAPSTEKAYPYGRVAPRDAVPAAIQKVPMSRGEELGKDLPPMPPEIVTPPDGGVACLRFGPSATGDLVASPEVLPEAAIRSKAIQVPADAGGRTANLVAVPAGGGVLAAELSAPGATPGTLYLITETGIRYPLQSAESAQALGYDPTKAMNVPAELLTLLPTGPVLSNESALASNPGVS